MSNFCGGIRLDGVTLKVINGVICKATADSVNIDDAVSTCGQLWDGASFKVERVNGCPVITFKVTPSSLIPPQKLGMIQPPSF